MMDYSSKKALLLEYIAELTREDSAIAFSGGVDSSLLLKLLCEAAKNTGKAVYAVTVETELHPLNDLQIASRVAEEAGARHIVLRLNELEEAGIRNNPVDRCYLCKRCLFTKLIAKAQELGAKNIIEGTNEDDLHVYRPGIKALKELSIISPLAKFGITKDEVRNMASEYGISVANRPSTPCMATRFPYGAELDIDTMRKVDKTEQWLRSLGLYNVRVRIHKDIARIEVNNNEVTTVLQNKEEIISKVKECGVSYVTLDLEGFRSGSMDINLKR